MSLQKTEASAGTAHSLFEESQLQLMFYVFEVAIVVPLFSFFRQSCFSYVLFLVLHTPFQRGASSEFPGVLRRSPPTVTVMFLAFYTDIESSRVESSSSSSSSPSCSWARSLGVGRAYRAGRAAFREPMVYRELF